MCGNGIVDNLPSDSNGNTVSEGECFANGSTNSILDDSTPQNWLQDWCDEFSNKDIKL